MADVNINVEDQGDETPIEVVEVPEWQAALSEVKTELSLLRSEIQTERTTNTELTAQLLSSNQSLTSQLQDSQRATMEMLSTRLPLPTVVVATPPTEEPPLGESETDPSEAIEETEIVADPPPEIRRPKRRAI